MAYAVERVVQPLTAASLTPPEINALLFYRLGQLVVWGQRHRELTASDPDLSDLLESATWALSRGGIREPDTWPAPTAGSTKHVQDSENVAFDAESKPPLEP